MTCNKLNLYNENFIKWSSSTIHSAFLLAEKKSTIRNICIKCLHAWNFRFETSLGNFRLDSFGFEFQCRKTKKKNNLCLNVHISKMCASNDVFLSNYDTIFYKMSEKCFVDFSFDIDVLYSFSQLNSVLTLNFSHNYGICISITSFITTKTIQFAFFFAIFLLRLSALCCCPCPAKVNHNLLRLFRAVVFRSSMRLISILLTDSMILYRLFHHVSYIMDLLLVSFK